MASTTINIRMDADLKRQFEAFCEDMGMSVTTAITIFAKKTVREYRIPFEIGAENPNAETAAALNEYSEMQAHPEKYKRYSSFADAMSEVLTDA